LTANHPITVLVTAIGGGGHGEQILKALRCAPKGRYRLLGADANPYCPQFSWVDKAFMLPRANESGYFEELLSICKNHSVQALFHGSEPELNVFAHRRDDIEAAGIFLPINPTPLIETCMNKLATAHALASAGFATPRYLEASNTADFDAVDFFPVVVKPALGGGGSANVYIAQDRAELGALSILLRLEESEQVFMIQEYIGSPNSEYTFGVLHDLDGEFLGTVGLRRLLESQLNLRLVAPNRTGRTDLGPRLVISSGAVSYTHLTLPTKRVA